MFLQTVVDTEKYVVIIKLLLIFKLYHPTCIIQTELYSALKNVGLASQLNTFNLSNNTADEDTGNTLIYSRICLC